MIAERKVEVRQIMRNSLFKAIFIGLIFLILIANGTQAMESGMKYQMTAEGRLQPANWQLKLTFDQPVSILEISRRISLKFNDKKAEFKIWNAKEIGEEESRKSLPPERNVFILRPAVVPDASGTNRVTISRHLITVNKSKPLKTDKEIVFDSAIGTTMLGFEAYFNSPTNKGVKIYLSDRISDHMLKKKIRIFPPIGYFSVDRQYSRTTNEYKVSGKFLTGQKYKIELLGGSLGEKDKVLTPTSFEFVSCGPKPEIRFAADRSVLELKSRQMIPLSFANIGNFKTQIMKIPAYFGPWLDSLTVFPEAEEKRPTEVTSFRLEGAEKKALESSAAELDNLMLTCVNRFAELKNMPNKSDLIGIEDFLTPEFSSNSEGYMGSDDPDKEYYFALPLDSRPDPTVGGNVLIRVNEADIENGQQATRLFQLTDLSITYKFSREELLLWVTSIETGKPVSGVSTMVMLQPDQTIFPGKTDKDGIIRISQRNEYPAISWSGNTPQITRIKPIIHNMLIAAAATPEDSCFIRLSTNRFIPSSVNMASPDTKSELGAKAHLFTERGVYKQKETVYWKATVREYIDKTIKPVSGEKVRVKIYDPRGEEIFSADKDLSNFGTCSDELKLTAYAPLGQYNIKLYRLVDSEEGERKGLDPKWDFLMNRKATRNTDKHKETRVANAKKMEAFLVSTGFQVQEFEPPRHYVDINLKLDKRTVKMIVGKETEQPFLECRIKSLYYTGGPLRHAKVQWTAYLTERDSNVKEYPLFQFGNNEAFKDLIESGNSVLDKNGELVLAIPVSQSVLSGINSIEVSATVLDVDARPSTGIERFSHQPEFKVGICKLPGSMSQGQEFPVQVIVLDQNGTRLKSGEVQLEIMRKKWFYTQKRDESGGIYYHWASGWLRNQSAKQQIKNDSATFELVLAEGGDYMLQATFKNSAGEFKSAYSFYVDYSYSSFTDMNDVSRMRSENEIILLADKSVAPINDKVKIRYSLPEVCEYALLTRETDELLSARVVKLDKPQGEFVELISEECRPNVFISMTAPTRRNSFPVYTSQMDSDYPRTYFGFTNIKVQNTVDKLNIAIAPGKAGELKALPGEEVELNFNVTDKNDKPAKAEVAICVVDEAVLSLTGYSTPVLDALADFMLPLSVFTGDLRTSLISQELFRLITTRALTGGDGGAGAITADLDIRKDFRPVAFWNPALLPDAQGNIRISFKLPDSMTSYRIYAVAVDQGAAFASAQRQMKVSKDFYLEPGLPRFLVAGDRAVFPLTFNNKSEQQGKATYQIVQAKNLTLTPMQGEVDMNSFSNSLSKLTLEAANGAGDSSLIVSGNFNGMTDAIERSLPIKPAATIINRQISGHFTKDHSARPEIPDHVKSLTAQQKSGTLMARLSISTSQWSRIVPTLSYLLRYPYGCVEQTSSGIIPLAAMRALIKEGRLPGISLEQVDNYLEDGINRLFVMQRPSGGFSYWPGSNYESWWGTQYAVLALTMAKRSGIDIDEERLAKAISHIRTGLFARTGENRYQYGLMAMAVVNLAMNSKIKPADMDILKARFSGIGGESDPLMILAESIAATSDKNKLHAMLKNLKPVSKSVDHSWYYSSTRQNAFSLMAILSASGNMKQADEFAGELLNNIGSKGYWNSTADTGIALLALAEYFKKTQTGEKENVDVVIKTISGERTVNTGKYGVVTELSQDELLDEKGFTLVCQDKVLVNWSLEYSYPDLENRKDDLHHGFSIEKTFRNLNGEEEIHVGDLIKVTVEFEDKFSDDEKYSILHYLAIEDPIPAGFIPVNSSLKNDSLPASERDNEEAYCGWREGAYTFYADHQEMQNDKLVAFKNRFWSGRFRLVYYVRAVCEGDFKMKPTRISLMYDPEIYGMTAPKTISVLPNQ